MKYKYTIVILSETLNDTKKYPKYVGKNSLSAKLNSWQPDNESLPKNLEIQIDIADKTIGMHNSTIEKSQCGTVHKVIPSLIQYTTSIQDVAFIVSSILNNKFNSILLLHSKAST